MSDTRVSTPQTQTGFSYVEMLIATVIVMASLGPAIEALQSARLAADAHGSETKHHYRLLGRMEDVLAEPFSSLTSAAATAGSVTNPSKYSDPVATQDRIVVYLSLYDITNSDGDNDVLTLADLNTDSDNNPYTGKGAAIEMVWIRAEIPGTSHIMESLSKR